MLSVLQKLGNIRIIPNIRATGACSFIRAEYDTDLVVLKTGRENICSAVPQCIRNQNDRPLIFLSDVIIARERKKRKTLRILRTCFHPLSDRVAPGPKERVASC